MEKEDGRTAKQRTQGSSPVIVHHTMYVHSYTTETVINLPQRNDFSGELIINEGITKYGETL